MNSKFKGDFNVTCIAMLFKCLFWIKFLPIWYIFSFILHAIRAQMSWISICLHLHNDFLLGRWNKTMKYKLKNSMWRMHFNGGHFQSTTSFCSQNLEFFFLLSLLQQICFIFLLTVLHAHEYSLFHYRTHDFIGQIHRLIQVQRPCWNSIK